MLGRRSSGASSCGELIAALHTFDQTSEPSAHSPLPAPPQHLKVREKQVPPGGIRALDSESGRVHLLAGCYPIRASDFSSWRSSTDKLSAGFVDALQRRFVSNRSALNITTRDLDLNYG